MSKSEWLYDFSESVAARMEILLREVSSFAELQRIQAIYFRAHFNDSSKIVAKRTGLALQTIRNLHSRWRSEGEKALELKKKGGRHHENLNLEQEEKLIEKHRASAEVGGILEVSQIHQSYEQIMGGKVAKSTTYRMLARHGWRKIAPRPKHPKSDKEAQEAFKKTGKKSLKKREKMPKI